MVENGLSFSGTAAEGPIRRLPPVARLSLRMKGNAPGTPRRGLGLSLDLPINRFSAWEERLVARLGPDEWLIVDLLNEADKLRAEFAAALVESAHAIVDVSQASIAFAIEGPDAANILNAGCPLDLDIRAFPPGSATRTILGKCEVVLFRLSKVAFRAECARSFGEYVYAFLSEAAELNVTAGAD
jgi:sarcosine oxidase subunit gamma